MRRPTPTTRGSPDMEIDEKALLESIVQIAPPVETIKRTGGDKLDSIPVTPRPKLLAVDDSYPFTRISLNSEWMSDDWDKVAAYAFIRMPWWQYNGLMDAVDVTFTVIAQDTPKEMCCPHCGSINDITRSGLRRKAFQQWANEKLK